MNNVVAFLVQTIQILTQFLSFAMIGRILLSWVNPNFEREHRIGQILYEITEPIINLARMLPHRVGMLDFSPVIALIGLDIIAFVLIRLLSLFVG